MKEFKDLKIAVAGTGYVGLWGVLSIVFLYFLIASGQQGHTGQ